MNNINLEKVFLEELKHNYYELYLCSLLANGKNADNLLTIISIFIEISSIPNKVSDKMVGYIRFAWWREALDEVVEKKPKNHPLLIKLAEFGDEIRIYFLKEIIDGCEIELEEEIDDYNFNQFLQKKYSSLFKLIENIIDPNSFSQIENFADFSVAFFIIIDSIIKNNQKYLSYLKFVSKDESKIKDPAYIKKLVIIASEKINSFEKNYKLYKQDLFIKLTIEALNFYVTQIYQHDCNIFEINREKYKFKLIINLYLKIAKAKFKSLFRL